MSNLSISYKWKNIKKSYKNNKFIILAPTRNGKFESPNGSYPACDSQDYFQYIRKNDMLLDHTTVSLTHDRPIRTYLNKNKNIITFKINQDIFTNS